jgi:hypothetical protein
VEGNPDLGQEIVGLVPASSCQWNTCGLCVEFQRLFFFTLVVIWVYYRHEFFNSLGVGVEVFIENVLTCRTAGTGFYTEDFW